MVDEFKTQLVGNPFLQLFKLFRSEFQYVTVLNIDQVMMVLIINLKP